MTASKCLVPSHHNPFKTGPNLVSPEDCKLKQVRTKAIGRVKCSPRRLDQICEDHSTSGDLLNCSSKKVLKSSAVPSIKTSWMKKIKKKTRNCVTDKCGFRLRAEVSKDLKSTLPHQNFLRSFQVNLKADQRQLVTHRDELEAELQLLDQILSLRELESLEMEYGLEPDVWWESEAN
ncbi:uncharacterized protein LOC117653266 [Thrips palmi]|uniref:Uncharacterized protein LOC117653266 n=1 Tax=Thrips palmi TaxID=161013 RepID=A0A6P9A9K9_THRPL|nr:uncharacterized protein LOC117653266 [Thrips palmi]